MAKAQMHGNSEKEGKAWGHGKFANMPTDVKMDQYRKPIEYGPTDQDDTMTRIDAENERSDSKARKYVSNQH